MLPYTLLGVFFLSVAKVKTALTLFTPRTCVFNHFNCMSMSQNAGKSELRCYAGINVTAPLCPLVFSPFPCFVSPPQVCAIYPLMTQRRRGQGRHRGSTPPHLQLIRSSQAGYLPWLFSSYPQYVFKATVVVARSRPLCIVYSDSCS